MKTARNSCGFWRTGWTEWQLRVHLRELCDLEYLAVLFGGNGRRTQYALFDGDDEAPAPLVTVQAGDEDDTV
jgi:hypothetical protein